MDIIFKKTCQDLYQDAINQERYWAEQIRIAEPDLKGSDQDIIHHFFQKMVTNVTLKQVAVNDSTGFEKIKLNIENEYLKSASYTVDDGGIYQISKERLGALRSILEEAAKNKHTSINSSLLDDPNVFNLVSGWIWEDLTERILEKVARDISYDEYIDEQGYRIGGFKYQLNKRSNKQKDMQINFDIDFDDVLIPINIDVKRNLDRFHVGDLTYTPLQINNKIDDNFNLADFLKTEVIKNKIAKTFPVFLSLKGGMDTLLSSEILSQSDNFFLKSEQKMPSNDEIHEMAVKILERISNPKRPSAKEVKQIVNNMELNMIKGSLWYAR